MSVREAESELIARQHTRTPTRIARATCIVLIQRVLFFFLPCSEEKGLCADISRPVDSFAFVPVQQRAIDNEPFFTLFRGSDDVYARGYFINSPDDILRCVVRVESIYNVLSVIAE